MAFSGDLSDFSLAELLFFLSSKDRSGWLTLKNDDSQIVFTLRHGRLVAAESSDFTQRLGQRLIDLDKVTPQQVEIALKWQERRKPRPPLGEVLVELGFVSHDDVRRTIVSQISESLFRILIRPGGTFNFVRGLPDARGVYVDVVIEREVLDAIRRADEWFAEQLETAPVTIAPQVTSDILEVHVSSDWPVLEAILDDARTLTEIVGVTGWSRDSVIEALTRLQTNGIVYAEIATPDPPIRLVVSG